MASEESVPFLRTGDRADEMHKVRGGDTGISEKPKIRRFAP